MCLFFFISLIGLVVFTAEHEAVADGAAVQLELHADHTLAEYGHDLVVGRAPDGVGLYAVVKIALDFLRREVESVVVVGNAAVVILMPQILPFSRRTCNSKVSNQSK
jgi:hypothetical protein